MITRLFGQKKIDYVKQKMKVTSCYLNRLHIVITTMECMVDFFERLMLEYASANKRRWYSSVGRAADS